MILKNFLAKDGHRVILRTITDDDLKRLTEFRSFINSVIEEDDFIRLSRKRTVKEEREWIKSNLRGTKAGERVLVIAERMGEMVGNCMICSGDERGSHIGQMGIAIKKECRGKGIGGALIETAIALAKNKLRSEPKIIRLSCMETNEAAQNLYRKIGFKIAAKIPNQIQRRGKLISELVMIKYL